MDQQRELPQAPRNAAEGADGSHPGRGDESGAMADGRWSGPGTPERGGLKVVLAMEPRSYREAIGAFFEEVRSRTEVLIVDPEELAVAIRYFRPDLVFSNNPRPPSEERWPSWLEFHPVVCGQPVTFYLDGRAFEIENAELEDLLSISDRVQSSLANRR